MRDDEWAGFVEGSKRGYVASMVDHGGIAEHVAREKAEHDFASLLPDRFATEGQYVFAVEDVDSGEVVGRVWFALRDINGEQGAFVYDIEIDDEQRGRGFGRAAMLALEDEVRALGLPRIALNVFGGNEVARGLYRSIGYVETAVWMSKAI